MLDIACPEIICPVVGVHLNVIVIRAIDQDAAAAEFAHLAKADLLQAVRNGRG